MSHALNETQLARCGQLLSRGADALDIALSDEQHAQLMTLLVLLHKWNRAYNLTAVREPEAMVTRHLLDSLSVLPYIKGPRLLDVGAGPGLPSIVIAIMRPDIDVVPLDSNGKKVRFQIQAGHELSLKNLHPTQVRIEAYDGAPFEQIISRAFADTDAFVNLSASVLAEGGEWLAMKGRVPKDEIARLPQGVSLIETLRLAVPGEEGERHLLRLKCD
ncbi:MULTISPECIES: 16S rRNA (guanine(527)-N(7))-methyltransferase RsmG [Cobetia]|uniref:Ribosomal RNA small subunit methyltransferase G n=1 Tax=Cobetia crustatorum TaxID=553385 RepID=A0A558HS10_9GAMM|nr:MULTISPECIES: 16S rRNA (guanine(527)-N(7))-methyltransferase RsmG [Cobetia]TVU71926.1 16S rRNA (guanine(527)-N(7))-methyltransferase RsmG [Cobetia crustatorum]